MQQRPFREEFSPIDPPSLATISTLIALMTRKEVEKINCVLESARNCQLIAQQLVAVRHDNLISASQLTLQLNQLKISQDNIYLLGIAICIETALVGIGTIENFLNRQKLNQAFLIPLFPKIRELLQISCSQLGEVKKLKLNELIQIVDELIDLHDKGKDAQIEEEERAVLIVKNPKDFSSIDMEMAIQNSLKVQGNRGGEEITQLLGEPGPGEDISAQQIDSTEMPPSSPELKVEDFLDDEEISKFCVASDYNNQRFFYPCKDTDTVPSNPSLDPYTGYQ